MIPRQGTGGPLLTTLSLSILGTDGDAQPVSVVDPYLMVAGYTGRDEAAVRRHIEELAAHGIDAPPMTPIFWLLPDWLLILAPATTQVHTANSSGEVEPVLLRQPDGEVFVTVGSDHTDRDLERSSLPLAKLTCPKMLSADLWRFADVASRWDTLRLRSRTGAQDYQEGTVATIRPPLDLLARAMEIAPNAQRPIVLFLGTIPLLTGGFVFAERFTGVLYDPGGERSLTCDYRVEVLSDTHR
jgi:4-hydroxyphenylacetate 3-monooxygenase